MQYFTVNTSLLKQTVCNDLATMKLILSLCVVLAVAALAHGAAVKGPITKANLYLGYVRPGDRLLFNQYVYQPAIPNTVQVQDVVFTGNKNTVSALRAMEVGYSQYSSVWVIGGGIGHTNVTLRVQSARGYGYYNFIEIWGN